MLARLLTGRRQERRHLNVFLVLFRLQGCNSVGACSLLAETAPRVQPTGGCVVGASLAQ